MKFKLNKKTAILLIIVLVILLVSAYSTWNTGWLVVNDNVPVGVYVGSGQDCKKVTNNGAATYFIPTKTVAEWDAFAANEPSGVVGVTADCCGGAGTDDAACGTVSCDDWHHKVGSPSPTGTDYCYDSPDIVSSRCEGLDNCKDANTADCGSADDTLEVSCGTCKYVNGCSGTTNGYCSNYGTSSSCSSTQDCDYLDNYYKTGTPNILSYCKYDNYFDTTRKCNGAGSCSSLNCGSPTTTTQATAGTCEYISGCSGSTPGFAVDSASGAVCGALTSSCSQYDGYKISPANSPTTTSDCKYVTYPDTAPRCEGFGGACRLDCFGTPGSAQATAGTCEYISGCTGETSGTVSNYTSGTSCGTDLECDGAGSCVSAYTWGEGVSSGYSCFLAFKLTGACSPNGATNRYTQGIYDWNGCSGEPRMYNYIQTCA